MLNFKISPKQINSEAYQICQILSQAGYQSYIVGGCVRDLLLGHKPKDFDICTDATPKKIMELFSKTIPTGLQHGTVTVVMGSGKENHFEVTTFRIEGEYSDGRRPNEVFFVMNVDQDLARRDLTINAIAFDPISEHLVDPYNGIKDLQQKIIRAVGNPVTRFSEDGLRIMRVARFASRFKYSIDQDTFTGIQTSLDTLKKVSKERIQDELSKILRTDNPSIGIDLLLLTGALDIICPFLTNQPQYLHFANCLDKCNGQLETRLALLYGNVNTEIAEKELLNLKFSNKEIKKVVFLLQLLDKYPPGCHKDSINSYKSFMATIKNCSPGLWENTLQQFIILTEAMGFDSKNWFKKYSAEIVFSKKEMQINGDDLIDTGMSVGPRIKIALDECYLEILRHPENNTKHYLLEYSRKY